MLRRREFLTGAVALAAYAQLEAAEAVVGSQRTLVPLGGVRSAAPTYSAEALAVFAAFTTPPSAARKTLINNCIVSIKSASVWTKLDALYMSAAADSQAALINWKSPGTFNSTAINSPTFTADQGWTGGATKYLDSNFNPSTAAGQFAQDSASVFAWSLTAIGVAGTIIGTSSGASIGAIELYPRYTDNNIYSTLNQTTETATANTDGSGLTALARASAANYQIYKNGASLATAAQLSTPLINSTIIFLNQGAHPYTGTIAAGGFGSNLTSADNLALYNALHTYMQAVAGVP